MELLEVGDYCKVTEEHKFGGMYPNRVGTTWQIESVDKHEDYCPYGGDCSEENDPCEDTATFYTASSTDGMNYGAELDPLKVEKLTERIPFQVYAEVVSEVYGTIYASSKADAMKIVKDDPRELLDNMTEMHQYSKNISTDI